MAGSPGGIEVGRLNLKVLPDTSDFVPKLEVFIEKVEHRLKVELPVELELKHAFEDLKDGVRAMNGYAHLHPVEIDTEIEVAGAIAHLDVALAAMQGTADLNKIHVDVEVDGGVEAAKRAVAGGLSDAARQGSSSMAQIGRQIALWGPLIFVAAVGIAALVPSLAVILPLVTGIAAAGAVMALGWKQVKDVVKPLADDFKRLRKEVGTALTAGFGPLVTKLSHGLIPLLSKALVAFATFVNGAITDLLRFLNSGTGLELIGQLFVGMAAALKPFADLITYTASVFLRLSIAALPALEMMGNALLDVTKDFNNFLKKGAASDVITQSMSDLGQVLKVLGGFVKDIFPPLMAAFPAVIAGLSGVTETIGGFFKLLTPVFTLMSKHKTTMGAFGAALTVVAIGLGIVAAATAAWNAVLAVNPITLTVIAIAALAAGLIYAYKHSEKFRNIVDTVFAFVKKIVGDVVDFVSAHLKLFTDALLLIGGPIIFIVGLIVNHFGTLRNIVVTVFTAVVSAISTAVGFIQAHLQLFATILLAPLIPIGFLVSGVVAAWGIIKAAFLIAVGVVRGIISTFTGVVSGIGSAFASAFSAVVSWIGRIVTYVFLLPGKIVATLVGFAGELYDVGADAMRGMLNGIKSMAEKLLQAAKDVINAPIDWVKHKLGIASPSKLFHSYGAWTIQGYQLGMESQASSLVSSMAGIMGGVTGAVSSVFNPSSIRSATSGLNASIGAIVDNTDSPHAQQVIINWNTGRGVMMDISDDALARQEFVQSQDDLMGVGA